MECINVQSDVWEHKDIHMRMRTESQLLPCNCQQYFFIKIYKFIWYYFQCIRMKKHNNTVIWTCWLLLSVFIYLYFFCTAAVASSYHFSCVTCTNTLICVTICNSYSCRIKAHKTFVVLIVHLYRTTFNVYAGVSRYSACEDDGKKI